MASPAVTALNRGLATSTWLLRPTLYWIGLVPGAWTFYLGVTDQLGADPMRSLERTLGLWALRFLIAALCVTTLRELLGVNLYRFRRALGLLTFYYATAHLTTYLLLDRGHDLHAIWLDLLKRPFITIGMIAFVILAPLAATSHDVMVRWLGAARWARLHQLVYVAALLAAVHFIMVVKAWPVEPMVYGLIVVTLLLQRVVKRLRS